MKKVYRLYKKAYSYKAVYLRITDMKWWKRGTVNSRVNWPHWNIQLGIVGCDRCNGSMNIRLLWFMLVYVWVYRKP